MRSGHRRLFLRSRRKGVSEVVGATLLLLMTVSVFSGIILFVNSIEGPGDRTFVDLVPTLVRSGPASGTVSIVHAGGETLVAAQTLVIIQVNSSRYVLQVADGFGLPNGTHDRWVTGERWQFSLSDPTLPVDAVVQVSVVDTGRNQLLLLAVVQRGPGSGDAFPIIGTATLLPNAFVSNTGDDSFTVRVIAVDYDGDLLPDGVKVDFAPLSCAVSNQTLVDTGFGVFESPSASTVSSCVAAGIYVLDVSATDAKGHTTMAKLIFNVVEPEAEAPAGSGTGPFGWAFNSRFQAYEIYNSTEWDSQRFNGTGTRDFVKGQTVVIVVASQFLKNIELQNDLMVYSPVGLPVAPVVYGGAQPSTTTAPSSTAAFDFEEFIAGYFIYVARFSTNSSFYGFNGSQLAAGQYNLDITLRTSNVPPPDHRFSTAPVINVSDETGFLPWYPKMEFFKDKNLTQPSGTFNFTETMFVKLTVGTTSDDAVIGAVTIADYQGGIQIFAPAGNAPVSAYTIKNATVYSFAIDLSSPNRDNWIFDSNAYGVKLTQFIDQDEKYAFSGQVIINGPKWAADVISAMREWKGFINDDRVYSVFYENGATWREYFVSSYTTGQTFVPKWAGKEMLDVMLADMDADGSLDAVEGSSGGWVILFRNLDGQGHEWDSYVIDELASPVRSIAIGHIDADPFNDVVAGTDDGQIWLYRNDGSWIPLECDKFKGKKSCDGGQSALSTPELVANVGKRVNDLKLADVNGDRNNDLIAAIDNNVIRIFYGDGFGSFGTTSTADYVFSSEVAVQGTVANTYTSTQTSNDAYERITEVTGTGQSVTSYSPTGEIMSLYGQIETGSYANTLALDGAPFETLSETFTGGGGGKWLIRNASNGASPGHQFVIGTIPSLGGGDTATVTVGGFLAVGTEPMEIRYKVGSGSVSSLLGTIDEPTVTAKEFALTGFTGGFLYIVVQDSDLSNGDRDTDERQTKLSLDLVRVDVIRADGTTSRMEHKWQSSAIGSGGAAYRLFLEANHSFDIESDDFLFEWGPSSTGPWSSLITVEKLADDDNHQSAILPVSVGGTQIWVRATDTNRDPNATELDTLSIDHMLVRRYISTPNTFDISTGTDVLEVVVGDMNRDGHNDIVGVRSNGGVIYFGPSFSSSETLPTPETAYAIDIGYIDDDDQLDVVIGENSQYIHVFYNNDGAYDRVQFVDLSVVKNTQTNYLRVGDVDGDGFDDIVICTKDGDVLFYRHLQGTGWEFEIIDNLRRPINTIDIGDVDRGVTFDYSGKI